MLLQPRFWMILLGIGFPFSVFAGDPPLLRIRIEELQDVDVIELDDNPSCLLMHDKTVLVGSFQGASLCVHDRTTGDRLRRFLFVKSGNDAEMIEDEGTERYAPEELSPLIDMIIAGKKLFLLPAFGESVLVVDLTTWTEQARIPLPGQGKFAITPDQQTVILASNLRSEFYLINASSLRFETVPYPEGGRGIGSLAVSQDGNLLLLGIQRGNAPSEQPSVCCGHAFLAVYDLRKKAYRGTISLAESRGVQSDDSIPGVILTTPAGQVYAGMWQSVHSWRVVNLETLQIDQDIDLPTRMDPKIPFRPVFSGDFHQGMLISLRPRGELQFWAMANQRLAGTLELGWREALQPNTFLLHAEKLYIAHPQYRCLYVVPVPKWKQN